MSTWEEEGQLPQLPPEDDLNAGDISEQDKVLFLENIYAGLNRQESAKICGFKGRHFRALCSPQSRWYDEDFARAYGQAVSSFEFEHNRLDRLRSEAQRRALLDSDRLLEKLLMVYDPDWEVLRQKTTDVNINVHAFVQQHLKQLPTDKLEQLLAWIDEGNSIEDADFKELPPAVESEAA